MKENSASFDLQAYLTRGVEEIVADAVRATLKNPKESLFMAKFAAASRAASKRRRAAERAGITKVFIPEENLYDLKDVAAEVKEKIEIVPVSTVQQLLEAVGILGE